MAETRGHCMDHSGECEKMRNAETNIESLWKVVDGMRIDIGKISVKVAAIVGAATVLQVVAAIFIPILLKH